MTGQNQARKDGKPLSAPNDDVVRNTVEPTEIKRELTDEDYAMMAGTAGSYAQLAQAYRTEALPGIG